LAFDHHYNADGTINPDKTNFYVPNEWVFKLTEQYPDVFAPTISMPCRSLRSGPSAVPDSSSGCQTPRG
jgi:predicted TIM-barrel fold metal-dependent hydrolase